MSEKAKAKKIKGDPGLFWPDWVKLPGLPAGEKKKLLILGSLLCLGVVFMLWSGKPGALIAAPCSGGGKSRGRKTEDIGKKRWKRNWRSLIPIKGVDGSGSILCRWEQQGNTGCTGDD